MGLFCVLCYKKARYNYVGSIHKMYCRNHKREGMVKIRTPSRKTSTIRKRTSQGTYQQGIHQSGCLICDLDFTEYRFCDRCKPTINRSEKLVLKYVLNKLDRNLKFNPDSNPCSNSDSKEENRYTVVTANFTGSAKHKLLDLELTFNSDKILLVNFQFDINDIETLEYKLSEGLKCLEEYIKTPLTKSAFVNV